MDCVVVVLSLALSILAGIAKGCMDTLVDHWSTCWFKEIGCSPLMWNKAKSWKMKYKGGRKLSGPRFPGSTTILVFTTDWWHRFQAMFLWFFTIAVFVIPNRNVFTLVGVVVLMRVSFEITYRALNYELKESAITFLHALSKTFKYKKK